MDLYSLKSYRKFTSWSPWSFKSKSIFRSVTLCSGNTIHTRWHILKRFCVSTSHLPAGIKDTPVIILLEGNLSVALREQLLGEDCTLFPGPCHSVGVQLNTTQREQALFAFCIRKIKGIPWFKIAYKQVIRSKFTPHANISVCVFFSELSLQRRGLGGPDPPRPGRRGWPSRSFRTAQPWTPRCPAVLWSRSPCPHQSFRTGPRPGPAGGQPGAHKGAYLEIIMSTINVMNHNWSILFWKREVCPTAIPKQSDPESRGEGHKQADSFQRQTTATVGFWQSNRHPVHCHSFT